MRCCHLSLTNMTTIINIRTDKHMTQFISTCFCYFLCPRKICFSSFPIMGETHKFDLNRYANLQVSTHHILLFSSTFDHFRKICIFFTSVHLHTILEGENNTTSVITAWIFMNYHGLSHLLNLSFSRAARFRVQQKA